MRLVDWHESEIGPCAAGRGRLPHQFPKEHALKPIFVAAIAAAAFAAPALADGPGGSAKLAMRPTMFDPQGSRENGMMYMPGGSALTTERPAWVHTEPGYSGSPRYITFTLGVGGKHPYAAAFDTSGETPRAWFDLNNDGDLTNDGENGWQKVEAGQDGGKNMQATHVFDVVWAPEGGETTKGKYGLNFYTALDREQVNYYRAAARTGEITLDGKQYKVTLLENDNDARYDKLNNPDAPVTTETPIPKPLWLMLDGNRFDIRGTFSFAGMNWLAKAPVDGSSITIEPTFKSVPLPRPVERPQVRAVGTQVPDFDVVDTSGKTINFTEYRKGKVIVLDLWATWCGPCRAAMPHVDKIARSAKGDVEFIAFNVYDEEAAYQRWLDKEKSNYSLTFLRDPAGRESDASIAKRHFNVSAIPTMFVIDKDGKIAEVVVGYNPEAKTLENALRKLGIEIPE